MTEKRNYQIYLTHLIHWIGIIFTPISIKMRAVETSRYSELKNISNKERACEDKEKDTYSYYDLKKYV